MITFRLCAAHYMEQCWIIINWAICNNLQWFLYFEIHTYSFKKSVWKCRLQNGGYLSWHLNNAKAQNEWIQIALNTYNWPWCLTSSSAHRMGHQSEYVYFLYASSYHTGTCRTYFVYVYNLDYSADNVWWMTPIKVRGGYMCACLHIVLWCLFMDVQLGVIMLHIHCIKSW